MNNKERNTLDKLATAVENSTVVAKEATECNAAAKTEADKKANRKILIILSVVAIVVIAFIYDQNRKADAREAKAIKRDAQAIELATLMDEQGERLIEQEKLLLEQRQLDIRQKAWAMATLYHISQGRRFTYELAEKVFAERGMPLEPSDDLPPAPDIYYWTKEEDDVFKSIVDKDNTILKRKKELFKKLTEKLTEHEEQKHKDE